MLLEGKTKVTKVAYCTRQGLGHQRWGERFAPPLRSDEPSAQSHGPSSFSRRWMAGGPACCSEFLGRGQRLMSQGRRSELGTIAHATTFPAIFTIIIIILIIT